MKKFILCFCVLCIMGALMGAKEDNNKKKTGIFPNDPIGQALYNHCMRSVQNEYSPKFAVEVCFCAAQRTSDRLNPYNLPETTVMVVKLAEQLDYCLKQ